MLSLADLTFVTKIVLVSQTEEVFQANMLGATHLGIVETDALRRINMGSVIEHFGVLRPLKTDVSYWGE